MAWDKFTTETDDKGRKHLVDEDGRRIYVANPSDRRWRDDVFVFWIFCHSPIRIAVYARGIDSGLEEMAGFADDMGWKGLFVDDAYLRELRDEALADLKADPNATLNDEDRECQAEQDATADMTYTESGYISSEDWGLDFDSKEGCPLPDALTAALAAFCEEVDPSEEEAEPDDPEDPYTSEGDR